MLASSGRELGEQGGVPGVLTPHNRGFNPCCLEAWFFHLINQGHLFVLENGGVVNGCPVFH